MKLLLAIWIASAPVWAHTVAQAREAIDKKDYPAALAIFRPYRSVSRAGIARLGVSTSPASTLPAWTGQLTC